MGFLMENCWYFLVFFQPVVPEKMISGNFTMTRFWGEKRKNTKRTSYEDIDEPIFGVTDLNEEIEK